MWYLAESFSILVSTVLIVAGTQKLASSASIAATLRALSVPRPRASGRLLGFLEVAGGIGVALSRSVVSSVFLLALGLAFSAAGLLAISRHLSIECACFGSSTSKALGWRQVAYLPLWVVAAGLPWSSTQFISTGFVERLFAVFVAALAASLVGLWQVLPVWTTAIDDRLRARLM